MATSIMTSSCKSRNLHHRSRLILTLTTLLLLLLLSAHQCGANDDPSENENNEAPTTTTTPSSPCEGRLALVTGGTGKTGRLTTYDLLEEGFCVRILTRNSSRAQEIFQKTVGEDPEESDRLLEFAEGTLGDGVSVPKAFEPTQLFGIDTAVSHVMFLAGGDEADFDAVNNRGVAECARQAAKVGSESMVVVSAGWVHKPYSLASVLFNSLFDNLPMAKHLQGENVLREIGREYPSLDYVILRAGRLVTDDEYPENAPNGLGFDQSDNFTFFGPAGAPGMSQTLLAKSVVTAMKVDGKYTVQLTSGSTPTDDVDIYHSFEQDSISLTLETDEEVDQWHQQAIDDLKMMSGSILVGAILLFVLLGWKRGIMLSLVVGVASSWFWSTYWADLSVASLVASSKSH